MVAGHVAGIAVEDVAGDVGEYVPVGLAAAVGSRGTFDLIRGCGGTPHEPFGEGQFAHSIYSILSVYDGVLGDDLFVPERAVFGRAFLGLKIDVDDAEPLGVALAPLEVVDQRPDIVAVDRDAGLDGAVDLGEVVPDVFEAARVLDLAVGGNGIGEAGSVLGYIDAFGHIVPVHTG